MKHFMYKLVSVLCLLTVLLVPCQVFAAEGYQDEEITPLMDIINYYTIDFGISGTTASVEAEVNGDYSTATKAKVIAELQVKNGSSWIPVEIWTEEENDYCASVDETHSVVKGHTYRVKATFTVWEGDNSETVKAYSDERTA